MQAEVVHASSNGTFGELLQGIGTNDLPFLITAPVNIYSKATFKFDSSQKHVKVTDLSKFKSQRLVDKLFEKYQLNIGGALSIQTQFPIGKGLGSSSADLVAVAKVISLAYSLNLNSEDIEEAIRGIEPTDGVMYPEVVSYYYKDVRINKTLGKVKDAMILGIDEGGEIDTLEYNKVKRIYTYDQKQIYDQLHESIEKALKKNDIMSLGKISTHSGELNQQFNPKKFLTEFVKISTKLNLPGIIVAHSGTYIGFLLHTKDMYFERQLKELNAIIASFGYKGESFYM